MSGMTSGEWAAWFQAGMTVITIIVGIWLHFHQADKARLREINKINWSLFEKSNLFFLLQNAVEDVVKLQDLDYKQLEFSFRRKMLVYRINEINDKCQQIKPTEMPSAAAVRSQIELKMIVEDLITKLSAINGEDNQLLSSSRFISVVYECTLAKQQIRDIDKSFSDAIKANRESYSKDAHSVVIGGG